MMPIKPILTDLVQRQVRLSKRAFGPGARTAGLRKHIGKELDEIRDAPLDVLEWIDVVILGLDGAWRAMRESSPWMCDEDLAEMVSRALEHKIGVNEEREWPDWREVGQDEPIEHVKADRFPPQPTDDELVSQRPFLAKKCAFCAGTGSVSSRDVTKACPRCGGAGRLDNVKVEPKVEPSSTHRHSAPVDPSCPKCNGKGVITEALHGGGWHHIRCDCSKGMHIPDDSFGNGVRVSGGIDYMDW